MDTLQRMMPYQPIIRYLSTEKYTFGILHHHPLQCGASLCIYFAVVYMYSIIIAIPLSRQNEQDDSF